MESSMVPQLRFPGFEAEWSREKVENVFSIFNGYAFSSSDSSNDGALWVKIADVGIQKMKKNNLSYLPNSFTEKYSKFLLKKNCYVVALTRPILHGELKIARINNFFNNSLLNQRVGKLESNENLDYIYYLLQNKRLIKSIENNIAGSDPPNLSPKEINNIKIDLPTPPEQTKIASFLTAVDKRINLLQKKKAELTQYKKGAMQKLFDVKENGCPTLRFKQDDGSDFPDWKEKKLGEVANFSKGKGISKADIVEDGTTECIRYGELYTVYSEIISKIVSKTNIDVKELVLSEENDVIIPASGETQIDIATASCVEKSGIAIGGDLNIIKSQIDGLFLSYYLNNARKINIARLAQGISVVHLYASQLAILKIDLPCLREQKEIADFLSSIDKSIKNIADKIEQSQTWKQGLLQKMFV